jgi:hypothetical protein
MMSRFLPMIFDGRARLPPSRCSAFHPPPSGKRRDPEKPKSGHNEA